MPYRLMIKDQEGNHTICDKSTPILPPHSSKVKRSLSISRCLRIFLEMAQGKPRPRIIFDMRGNSGSYGH